MSVMVPLPRTVPLPSLQGAAAEERAAGVGAGVGQDERTGAGADGGVLGLPTVRPPLPVMGLLRSVVAPVLVWTIASGGAEGQGAADDGVGAGRSRQAAAAQRQREAGLADRGRRGQQQGGDGLVAAEDSVPVSLTMSPGPAAAMVAT